jgi:Holliday junction resolvasome RuvABC endonuclease subunit
MIVLSVDPGARGAVAVLDTAYGEPEPIEARAYSPETLHELLRRHKPDECVVEDVLAAVRAPAGIRQTFAFGKSCGVCDGIIFARTGEMPQRLSPQEWKKAMGLIGTDKSASVGLVREMFPGMSLRRTERSRKDDDGIAEAILIGLAHIRRGGQNGSIRTYEGL